MKNLIIFGVLLSALTLSAAEVSAPAREPTVELSLSLLTPSSVHGILTKKESTGMSFMFLAGQKYKLADWESDSSSGFFFNYDVFRTREAASPTSPFTRESEVVVNKPDLGIYLSFWERQCWKPLGFSVSYSIASLAESDKNLQEWGFFGVTYFLRYQFARHWLGQFSSSYYSNISRSNSVDTYNGFWLNRLGVGYAF